MSKQTVRDVLVTGKKVLLRCDFNVPLGKDENKGEITDNKRIVESLPTIKYLRENGAKVILCSHLGKPKGEVKEDLSLAPVREELSKLLGTEVGFAKDIIGEEAKALTGNMRNSDVVLLENLRFNKGEEANDPEFAKQLADLADIFAFDAFGTGHRAHASTAGVTKYLPAVSGFLVEKELRVLGEMLNNPKHPFAAILGGSKVSDKIKVIEALLKKVDTLVVGGAMSNTFLKAQGHEVGESKFEEDGIEIAKGLMQQAKQKGVNLVLPVDVVMADEFSKDANYKTVSVDSMEPGWQALDVGEETLKLYEEALKGAKTILWNGPVGVFEFPNFAKGTNGLAKIVAESNATTVIGGGDTASAINKTPYAGKMTHISTGGGATLEFIENDGKLPAVECLQEKEEKVCEEER